MRLRLLPLALLAPLFACTAAAPEPEMATPQAVPEARFTYHAGLARVPAGAREVRLGVRLPRQDDEGELRLRSVFGLVGNAPFDLVLPDSPAGTLEHAHLRLTWRSTSTDGAAEREIVLETRGKPAEFGLRLALPAGARTDAATLASRLAARTFAEVDAQAVAGVVTRCERMR